MQYPKICSATARACALICMLFSSYGNAQDVGIQSSSFARDQSALVLEYRRYSALVGRDQATEVKVFGNGTIFVTFPRSYKNAGEYTFDVSSEELDTLLAEAIQSNQVTNVNSQMVSSGGEVFAVSDSTFTEIDIDVISYSLASGQTVTLDSTVRIREKDLAATRQLRASASRLANLSVFEAKILNLTRDARLVKK